jgi:hypothetical protein
MMTEIGGDKVRRTIVPVAAFLALAAWGALRAPELYVSTSGDDANPGTLTRPCRTLQHAADLASPGTTVDIRGGVYCQQLAVKVSGSAEKGPVIFRSHPGETAVIDGSCLTPPEGGPRGGDALVAVNNVSYVRIEGLEIRNYRTSDRRRTPAGIRVSGAGSHIEIVKNNVHHIEQNFPGQDRPGSGGNAFGIAVYGTNPTTPISDLLVDGNEVHHLKTGSSESLVLNGNVAGFRVTRNVVHDNNNIGIDLIGHERSSPDPETDRARDGVISGNLVYNITSKGNPAYGEEVNSDGIYVDGGTRLLIERNIMHDVDFGIELASEHFGKTTSHITARNNLIYGCHTAGITIGGYDEKRGVTEHCIMANNTLYANDTWGTETGEFMMQFYLRNNFFENNIIYVGRHGRVMTSKSGRMSPDTPTVTMNHNLYYFQGGSKAARWRFDNQDYPTFEDYVGTTGNDRNSRFADPLFVNPAANDFRLRKDSPALGTGRVASLTGTEDLAGAPRVKHGKVDVGCYQVQ